MPTTPYSTVSQLTPTRCFLFLHIYFLFSAFIAPSSLPFPPPSAPQSWPNHPRSLPPNHFLLNQPSKQASQLLSEEQASFFLTRPDNTTHKLNAPAPSLHENSSSMLEQKRQLAELLKNFSYQAPTSLRSNTSISPLSLSKNLSRTVASERRRGIRMHRFILHLSTRKHFIVLCKLIYSLINMQGNL